MQNETWNCPDLIIWTSHERRHLDGSICLCTIPIYASMPMAPLHIFQSPMPFALMHPHTMKDVSHLLLVKVWIVPFVFGTENWMSVFPKNKLKRVLIWPHFSTVYLTIWDELWPRELGGITALMYSLTYIQVAFLDAVADCGKLQGFSEVLLRKCSYI